ncbi:MAG: isoprenylcysteine carboxylmethyltransferase family protein [Candidatus Obscuribacterales bacterium]|nr:isoprenylcysteine carboxylmethyltransferase family protein [Candidatus Obscuribacterales bacterium]
MKPLPICRHVYSRVARPASASWNLAKTFIQAFTIWGIFLFWIPWILSRFEARWGIKSWHYDSPIVPELAVVLFIACGVFALSCGVLIAVDGKGTPLPFDAAQEFVIKGPFRYVRNPMALGSFTQGCAVGLFLGSPLVMLYSLVGALYWNFILRPWEELDLRTRFGDDFVAYERSVRCWIPRIRPYNPCQNNFKLLGTTSNTKQ